MFTSFRDTKPGWNEKFQGYVEAVEQQN